MDNVIKRSPYGSDMTLKGVKLSGPKGEKEVQISGDEKGETLVDSFFEGATKGMVFKLVGPHYPLLLTAFKSVEGYSQVYETAKKLGLDESQSSSAGLKGAFIGGLKGLEHAFLDFIVIGTLTAAGGALGGPVGAVLASTIGGGLYNVLKDAIIR